MPAFNAFRFPFSFLMAAQARTSHYRCPPAHAGAESLTALQGFVKPASFSSPRSFFCFLVVFLWLRCFLRHWQALCTGAGSIGSIIGPIVSIGSIIGMGGGGALFFELGCRGWLI